MFRVVARHPQALPQYTVGHLTRILQLEERGLRYGGLAVAGNWLRGVGVPDCIAAGERAADQLITYLERPAPSAS
jgi:oxygen-dependent protoporphyrinogen oxidase